MGGSGWLGLLLVVVVAVSGCLGWWVVEQKLIVLKK